MCLMLLWFHSGDLALASAGALNRRRRTCMQQPADQSRAPGNGTPARPRPESLLLALLGAHLLGRDLAVGVGSVIEVLGRLGIGEHATRATLKRMRQRGLLRTVRRGRHAYTSLTPYAEAVLQEGAARLDAEVVNR